MATHPFVLKFGGSEHHYAAPVDTTVQELKYLLAAELDLDAVSRAWECFGVRHDCGGAEETSGVDPD